MKTYTQKELDELTKQKDNAYWERNQLVLALTKIYPSWRELHPASDTTWDNDWRNIIFIQLPTGQASWHIHDSELHYFAHLQFRKGDSWDGHTTEEKYNRLRQIKDNQLEEYARQKQLELLDEINTELGRLPPLERGSYDYHEIYKMSDRDLYDIRRDVIKTVLKKIDEKREQLILEKNNE